MEPLLKSINQSEKKRPFDLINEGLTKSLVAVRGGLAALFSRYFYLVFFCFAVFGAVAIAILGPWSISSVDPQYFWPMAIVTTAAMFSSAIAYCARHGSSR